MDDTTSFPRLIAEMRSVDQAIATSAANELADVVARFTWNCLARFPGLSAADRQDLSQDVCERIFTSGLASFRGDSNASFLAYLRTAARNAAFEHLKRAGRHPDTEFDEGTHGSPTGDPARELADREELAAVVRCAAVLEAIDHEIFWMRINGWQFEKISEALDLPLGTVASKEHRARRRIRACLEAAGIVSPVSSLEPPGPRSGNDDGRD